MSNSLKPQRRFTVTGLDPATEYVLYVEAHNVAGSSNGQFSFFTLTKDGGSIIIFVYLSLNYVIESYNNHFCPFEMKSIIYCLVTDVSFHINL